MLAEIISRFPRKLVHPLLSECHFYKEMAMMRWSMEEFAGCRPAATVGWPGRVGNIMAARAQSGLSQAEFALALGVSKRTLENWEQGRAQPTGAARMLLKLTARFPDTINRLATICYQTYPKGPPLFFIGSTVASRQIERVQRIMACRRRLFENRFDGITQTANARLAVADRRIDGDAVSLVHECLAGDATGNLRQYSRFPRLLDITGRVTVAGGRDRGYSAGTAVADDRLCL